MVGFVRCSDPISDRLKGVIGPHRFTPKEITRRQAEGNGMKPPDPEDIGVVSFVIPFFCNTLGSLLTKDNQFVGLFSVFE